MDGLDVPHHFLCPISLQLMRDPVTISSGITYDRVNIEKWLFSCNNTTCPVTKQVILFNGGDITPNHTLRRLIQAWCNLNASNGIELPLNKSQIAKLVEDAKCFPHLQLMYLKKLKSIALDPNFVEDNGVIEFLVSVITRDRHVFLNRDDQSELTSASDEALNILYCLKISEGQLKNITMKYQGQFKESLLEILKHGNYKSRAYSIMLLKSILEIADPLEIISIQKQFFQEIIHVLRDQISHQASKAALKLLVEFCPWGRNRIKAVEVGAVSVLIELLLERTENRATELMLVVLDLLCGCAEGRAELLKHGGGLAIVSKKILRVSHVGTDRAVRILCSICKFSATSRVLQEMLQVGVVATLCLLLQVETSFKSKERAKEILKLHSRVWRNSACIPPHLISYYPS